MLKSVMEDLKEPDNISMELLLLNFNDLLPLHNQFSQCHLELTSKLACCCLNVMQIPHVFCGEKVRPFKFRCCPLFHVKIGMEEVFAA